MVRLLRKEEMKAGPRTMATSAVKTRTSNIVSSSGSRLGEGRKRSDWVFRLIVAQLEGLRQKDWTGSQARFSEWEESLNWVGAVIFWGGANGVSE